MTSLRSANLALGRRPATARRPIAPALPGVAASPFVKWVGGKGRLLQTLHSRLPPGAELMRHVEPFAGGGALFFSRRPGRALLNDANVALMDTYRAVRDEVEAVIDELQTLAEHHNTARYYEVRQQYNATDSLAPTQRAAMFIYLNKTCFNGLHRVNRRGLFNVPAGRYERPRILDATTLRAASQALGDVELRAEGFDGLLKWGRPGDFVYFDPPYEPLSRTANFTHYTGDGFDQQDQIRLRDIFAALDKRRCALMLSNSDTPFIRELYARWNIDTVEAPRAINCNGQGRGRVAELLIRNYG